MITVANVAGVLSLAFFLALVVERLIQFVIRPLLEAALGKENETVGRVLPYLAALMGGLVSYGFGLDLFADMAAAAGLEPAAWLTKLLTALVVAGGSNLLHDLWPTGGQLEPLQLEIIDDDGSMTTISQ
jgi:hypothetical protein